MNNEIKEILDRIETASEIFDCLLKPEECTEILDYITNLQRNYDRIYDENCKLREEHNITDVSLLDENHKLQQENERLKELNAELKAITKRPTPIDYAMIQKRYEDYKSRCEKAVEYLNKYDNERFWQDDVNYMGEQAVIDLLNILQNGSDSQ